MSTSSISNAKYLHWSMTRERCASVSVSGVIVVESFVYVAMVGREIDVMWTVSPRLAISPS
jgi:hypothetical protein